MDDPVGPDSKRVIAGAGSQQGRTSKKQRTKEGDSSSSSSRTRVAWGNPSFRNHLRKEGVMSGGQERQPTHPTSNRQQRSKQSSDATNVCFKCGKPGHFIDNCHQASPQEKLKLREKFLRKLHGDKYDPAMAQQKNAQQHRGGERHSGHSHYNGGKMTRREAARAVLESTSSKPTTKEVIAGMSQLSLQVE